jgi:hypothetical protein
MAEPGAQGAKDGPAAPPRFVVRSLAFGLRTARSVLGSKCNRCGRAPREPWDWRKSFACAQLARELDIACLKTSGRRGRHARCLGRVQ